MPLRTDCIEAYKRLENTDCFTCSDRHSFALSSVDDLEVIYENVASLLVNNDDWVIYAPKISYIVRLIIEKAWETGLNDENGGLNKNIGKHEIGVAVCFDDKRLLLYTHDSEKAILSDTHDTLPLKGSKNVSDILESCSLEKIGVKVNWHFIDKFVFCSIDHPDSIVWDESYSVGVSEFDDQHKELVSILNELLRMKNSTFIDTRAINEIVFRLHEYTDYHFNSEEEEMVKSTYPDIKQHIYEHTLLKSKVKTLCSKVKDGGEIDFLDTVSFLTKWLTKHILDVDKRMGRYITTNNSSATR